MKILLLILGCVFLLIIILFLYCSLVLAKECDTMIDKYMSDLTK